MKTKGIKITGTLIVSPSMHQIKIGQKGFLDKDAIILVDKEIFIDTSYSVLETKEAEAFVIPIERIGEGKEDFKIDLNVIYEFTNFKLNEKEKEEYEKDENIIGPFKVNTTIYDPSDYRTQKYPRMDLEELIFTIKEINYKLAEQDDEIHFEDKKILREFIKEKLSILSIDTLKTYQKDFPPISEEEKRDSIMLRFTEDEEISDFITKLIKEFESNQFFNDMSLSELQEELGKELEKPLEEGDQKYIEKLQLFIKDKTEK